MNQMINLINELIYLCIYSLLFHTFEYLLINSFTPLSQVAFLLGADQRQQHDAARLLLTQAPQTHACVPGPDPAH